MEVKKNFVKKKKVFLPIYPNYFGDVTGNKTFLFLALGLKNRIGKKLTARDFPCGKSWDFPGWEIPSKIGKYFTKKIYGGTFEIRGILVDTGYPQDGRADKDSYPHDRHKQCIMLSL